MSLAKDEAKRIIENLPEEATWDDIMYQLYVKEKVEKSLDDVEQGKLLSHDEVKKRLFSKWN